MKKSIITSLPALFFIYSIFALYTTKQHTTQVPAQATITDAFTPFLKNIYSFYIRNKEKGVKELALFKKEYKLQNIDDTTPLSIHEGFTRKNEAFSELMVSCNINYKLINEISKKQKKIFDVTKIQDQKRYVALCDTNSQAKIFIYEENNSDFVVFDFSNPDKINVYKDKKAIEKIEKTTIGTINGSLYATLASQQANPLLAISLASAFAWSIDFFRIKDGDNFKVVYEESYVNHKQVGLPALKSAYIQHNGEDYYVFGVPNTKTGDYDYFDEKGKSVRKNLLKSPLKFSRISSRYNLKRLHPVLKRVKAHLGTDYAAPQGTPILSVGEGKVIAADYSGGNGRFVKIKHDGTYTSQYLHMSRFAKGIKEGAHVMQGQVIGYVGSTGLATGPHLCFRLWKNGQQIDHLKDKIVLPSPSVTNIKHFVNYRDSLLQVMAYIKPPAISKVPLIYNDDTLLNPETDSLLLQQESQE